MTIQMPQPGDVFLTYRIENQIGKGGFSTVYSAVGADGQRVAVKIITPSAQPPLYDRDLRDRVIREGQLLSQLRTPFTINIFGHGEAPNGLLYMIFEYITGDSLFDLIKGSGPQPVDRIIGILRQTLMGLQRAHELGILHRDIKPNNIMLFREGTIGDRVKVLDFGIAKRYDDPSTDLTAAGLLVGTPRYMSPEQLRGGALGPRTDIYSLGLCAVELLTGKKAVWGKNKTEVIASQIDLNTPIPIPAGIAPLPFIAIVRKMVAKNAADRYVQATDVLRDIDLFIQGKV